MRRGIVFADSWRVLCDERSRASEDPEGLFRPWAARRGRVHVKYSARTSCQALLQSSQPSRVFYDKPVIEQPVHSFQGRSGHLEQLQLSLGQCILAQRIIQAVSEPSQVSDHASKAAEGKRAGTRAGIPNLQDVTIICAVFT